MKNKMSLLQEGIIRYHEDNCKLLFQNSVFTKRVEKEIGRFTNFKDKEEELKFTDLLEDYAGEYYWGGVIDGFRMCLGLVKELEQFESHNFLKDLLTDDDREI